MNEMQGAVGIAQLKKLKFIIKKQKKNHDLIWNAIKTISGVSRRNYPKGSSISADALIIFVKNKKKALDCRKELLKYKISTKILPEAYTWHFASTWKHMKELKIKHPNLKNSFHKSRQIIDKAVSIPIFVKMEKNLPKKIKNAIKKAIQ